MRRSWDRLIFIMGISILVRWHLYIETAPRHVCQMAEVTALMSADNWVNFVMASDATVVVYHDGDAQNLEKWCKFIRVMAHEHQSISNHWQLDCLLNSLFMPTTKKTLKLHIAGPLWGESIGDFRIRKDHEAGKWFHVTMLSWSRN